MWEYMMSYKKVEKIRTDQFMESTLLEAVMTDLHLGQLIFVISSIKLGILVWLSQRTTLR